MTATRGSLAVAAVVALLLGCERAPDGGDGGNNQNSRDAGLEDASATERPDAGSEDAGRPPDGGPTPVRVLYITEAAGYVHEVLPHSVDVLSQLSGPAGFTLNHQLDFSDAITEETLAATDVLVLYTTNDPPLDGTQRQAILDFVSGGGGLVALHSGTASMDAWPEYGVLTGARFRSHPWFQTVGIHVVDPGHAINAGLPGDFTIHDEIYQFSMFRPDLFTVLLELDVSTVDLTPSYVVQEPWGFPLAWQGPYGNGRVFCTALGHTPEAWDNPNYRTLVRNGIVWAAGR